MAKYDGPFGASFLNLGGNMNKLIKIFFRRLLLNIKICFYKILMVICRQRKQIINEAINSLKLKIKELEGVK